MSVQYIARNTALTRRFKAAMGNQAGKLQEAIEQFDRKLRVLQ
jgi:hypothetical protein